MVILANLWTLWEPIPSHALFSLMVNYLLNFQFRYIDHQDLHAALIEITHFFDKAGDISTKI
jgi:hypothetical protein